MINETDGITDIDNYLEMQRPFTSTEDAKSAIDKFYDAVYKARNEFHIAEVHLITKINLRRGDCTGAAQSSAHFGNTLEGESMCAWGLGQETADRQQMVAQLINSKGKS